MEDITLGRRTVGRNVGVGLAAGATLVIPANGRRTRLFFGGSASAECTILTGSFPSTPTQDQIDKNKFCSLQVADNKMFLRIEDFGTLVQTDFTIWNNTGGGANYSYSEMILLE